MTDKPETRLLDQQEVIEAEAVATTELAVRPAVALVPRQHFSKEQLDLIVSAFRFNMPTYKDGRKREAREDEVRLYMHRVKGTGLDPLANQICAVWRWDKRLNDHRMTIQTQIDGFRLIAARTGQYAGNDGAQVELDENGKPVAVTVTVYRIVQGIRCPFTATARWTEYYPGTAASGYELSPMWSRMPVLMLTKCAEAQALRMGFPAELSGLYTHDEMAQADMPEALPAPDADPFAAQAPPRAERQGPCKTVTEDDIRPLWKTFITKPAVADLSQDQRGSRFKEYASDIAGKRIDRLSDWTPEIVEAVREALSPETEVKP